MSDLEQSIADWRQQMLAAGIKTPVPLEELEIHLREEIERQKTSGLNEQNSFEISVQRIGQPKMLKSEFKKSERTFMKRKLTILVGILILLLGVCMILPSLGKHKQRNQTVLAVGTNFFKASWADDELYWLAWGIPFAVVGAGATLYGFKKRMA
jgi:hypothetical protein